MANHRRNSSYNKIDDLTITDDNDLIDTNLIEEDNEQSSTNSNRVQANDRDCNIDMRSRIEQRMEERRLEKELNEYEFFDIDKDDEILH